MSLQWEAHTPTQHHFPSVRRTSFPSWQIAHPVAVGEQRVLEDVISLELWSADVFTIKLHTSNVVLSGNDKQTVVCMRTNATAFFPLAICPVSLWESVRISSLATMLFNESQIIY